MKDEMLPTTLRTKITTLAVDVTLMTMYEPAEMSPWRDVLMQRQLVTRGNVGGARQRPHQYVTDGMDLEQTRNQEVSSRSMSRPRTRRSTRGRQRGPEAARRQPPLRGLNFSNGCGDRRGRCRAQPKAIIGARCQQTSMPRNG